MLNDAQAQALRQMMMMDGWNKVLKPWEAERGKRILRALAQSKDKRDEAFRDVSAKELRGQLKEIEWILSALDNELIAYDANRRRDELARQDQEQDPTANP